MVTSENNKYLLKMIPSYWGQQSKRFFKLKTSIGTVFKLSKKGDFLYQWNAKNVHPSEAIPVPIGDGEFSLYFSDNFRVFLSNDGLRVVKLKLFDGSLFERNKLTKKDFLTIYYRGKVSHRYSYTDFYEKLPSPTYHSCYGAKWVSEFKLNNDLLSFGQPLYPESRKGRRWSVDIVTGKKSFQ